MEDMLALLPPWEPEGMLPVNIRDHVVTTGFTLTSREMAYVADNLWFARNSGQSNNKHHPVAEVVPEDTEELEEAVAALATCNPSTPSPRRRPPRAARARGSSATATRALTQGERNTVCTQFEQLDLYNCCVWGLYNSRAAGSISAKVWAWVQTNK